MREVTKYRIIIIASVIAVIVLVEVMGWQSYAHVTLIGLGVYFLIVGIVIISYMGLKYFVRRIVRKRRSRAWPYTSVHRKQALGRIKRDINRLKDFH